MQLDDSLITTREVTDWQGLHLFHFDLSSCSQKVRIVFRELGVPFVPHPINLMRDEQRTDWYLGINPRGEVPVLVHDGVGPYAEQRHYPIHRYALCAANEVFPPRLPCRARRDAGFTGS